MNITPLDIRKQTFRRSFKGFAMDDVMAFLGVVADQMETLVGEQRTMSEKVTSLEFQLAGYKEIEAALRSAMVTAERAAEETRRHADKEEEMRLREVEIKVQTVVDEASDRIRDLKREIGELEKEKAAFIARFRLLVEAQLKMLDLKIADDEEENLRRVADLQEELLGELEKVTRHDGGARAEPTPEPSSSADPRAE